jgi:hypothetical protein
MKTFFVSATLTFISFFSCYSQGRYTFGTDYILYYFYGEDECRYCAPSPFLVGLSASKEVSLRSEITTGLYYYWTSQLTEDKWKIIRNYLEMPVGIKTYLVMFERRVRPITMNGIGVNFRFNERRSTSARGVSEHLSENKVHFDAINIYSAWGVECKITNAFFLRIDGMIKLFYHPNKSLRLSVDHFNFSPAANAGIFLRLK